MKKYDLYIPLPGTSIGGPNTFLRNFHSIAKELGCCFDEIVKSNIFFPISHELSALDKIKSKKGKIIQRLDGVYYPEKHGERYTELNKEIAVIYSSYADHVIFQSDYSRKQCFEMFGPRNNYSIICNGVSKRIFKKKRYPAFDSETKFITTGNFRNIDMLEPIILALDSLANSYKFKLMILGPVSNNLLLPLLERDYCEYMGPVTEQKDIAAQLCSADAFIYTHLNPPCPNSVLEAISSGLPVIGYDSGSMSELCHFNKNLLAFVSEKVFHSYEDFKIGILVDKIELFLKNKEQYAMVAHENAEAYSMENCVREYLQTFESLGVFHSNIKFNFGKSFFKWRNKDE